MYDVYVFISIRFASTFSTWDLSFIMAKRTSDCLGTWLTTTQENIVRLNSSNLVNFG